MKKTLQYIIGLFFIVCLIGCKQSNHEDPLVSHPGKKIKDIDNFNEALQARNYYKTHNQPELTIASIERAITLADNQAQTEHLVLELADMLLAQGDFAKAQKVYKEFKSFYPGSPSIEYALYQELLSYHLASLSSDRDQSSTHKTITLAQHFLERFEQSTYRDSVYETQSLAYHKLWDSELNQIEFYLNKFVYEPTKGPVVAARNRLEYMKEQLLPHIQQVNKVTLAQLETQVTHYLSKFDEKIETLEESAPQKSTILAEQRQELQSIMRLARTITAHPVALRDRF